MTRELLKMKDIGELFGKSSHEVGKAFKQLGLRTARGNPTDIAKGYGYAGVVLVEGYTAWHWDRHRVVPMLCERIGWRVLESNTTPK